MKQHLLICARFFAAMCAIAFPAERLAFADDTHVKYFALPLGKSIEKKAGRKILDRYGVPFVEGALKLSPGGSAKVDVGGRAKRIFLLGMTESPNISCWADPRDYSARC